jgi:hypothetical protein
MHVGSSRPSFFQNDGIGRASARMFGRMPVPALRLPHAHLCGACAARLHVESPARALSASHAYAHSQQLQQVTKRGRGR